MYRAILPLLLVLGALAPAASAQDWHAIVTSDRHCVRPGAEATTKPCTRRDNAFVAVYYSAGSAFALRTENGQCLDAGGGRGRPIVLAACTEAEPQRWRLLDDGRIQSVVPIPEAGRPPGSGGTEPACLGSDGTGPNRPLLLQPCTSGSHQRFAFGLVENGAGADAPYATVPSNHILNGRPVRAGLRVNSERVRAAGTNRSIVAGGRNVALPSRF